MIRLFNTIHQGYDLVIGYRHNIAGSYYEINGFHTAIKGFINKMGNIILNILNRMEIHDFLANFRAIKKNHGRALIYEKIPILCYL